ncbi:hypothetical protein MIMGU_mgv1a026264mg [Erythranthe guttata]|uniref:CRC domain-containing protein n=1 Tax=Erythranthe guttata TaxID=4155 RepID=A0A022PXC5_ERYGU|nr:hypothetical protein MIMGU_mgv1a026264mg [Erythranthe guttata]
MEQGETAAGALAASPVVRQLDFTINFKSTAANANANANLILPEHPQAQLQSKLLALIEQKQVHANGRAQSPPRTMESPKSRERSNLEQNDGTPKKQKQCNCKNSRCLKLYCECFASGSYCDGCNCTNCYNNLENEPYKKESVRALLEKNPDAFKPKISGSPHGAADGGVEYHKGCNCKKSGCLKRYCDCFQANILCSDRCKCCDCKNYEGSKERNAHFHHHSSKSMALIQLAANAAINEAIGIPSKTTRNNRQIIFGTASNKQQLASWLPKYPQETCSTSKSPLSAKQKASVSGLSKSSYKSPLAGILQPQHVKDLCKVLVEVSAEAAAHKERKPTNNSTNANEAEKNPASSSHESDTSDNRPLSPGTLALMCDEQDATFMAANAPQSTTTEPNTRTNNTKPDLTYVDQERLVLTRFCSFLNKLITCGSIEGRKKVDVGQIQNFILLSY